MRLAAEKIRARVSKERAKTAVDTNVHYFSKYFILSGEKK